MNGTDAGTPSEGLNFTPEQLARFEREQALADEQEARTKAKEEEYQNAQAAEDAAKEAEAKENIRLINAIHDEAERILQTGKPFDYFLKTFQKDHAGDLTVARCMALIFAASAVVNGDGLHGIISGKSGGGKSHAAITMISQLPAAYRFERQFSEKHLFYAGDGGGINEGAVVLIDDKTLSETQQELLKGYTTKYHEGVTYGTVFNQKAKDLTLPPRLSFVLLKVDDPGDDQILNRMIQCRVNEDVDKIKAASFKIQGKYRNLLHRTVTKTSREIEICREMWNRIKSEMIAVEVPCAEKVWFADFDNLRNHEIFFNMLMCHAAINRWQRKVIGTTEDGIPVILATKDDFKEAVAIYEALFTFGGQRNNTTEPEDKIVRALQKIAPVDGLFTIREAATIAGMNYKTAFRALNGRKCANNAEVLGGLLQKCPSIQKIGKRGRFETENSTENTRYGEIIRKEHLNEDVYFVELESLNRWVNTGSPVTIEPGFKWEA